ncbi:hypothetical protein Dsin_031019 [Dipteronia sinensis]|uniref:F-box domain-containing protein n=1 Tax=Dipteronia sinensis TaxID=43782 RepID=A0AAD9ZL54_9ROSI|nr:hypothetical protein Dsin_031019 [Dipteronia sinensis]
MVLNGDNAGNIWSFSGLDKESEDWNWEVVDRTELGESPKVAAHQILGELPDDPFGMEIKSTITAITGWFQEFDTDFGSDLCGSGMGESEENIDDRSPLSGFNLVWNSSSRFQQEKGVLKIDEISIPYGSFNEYGFGNGLYDGGDVHPYDFCEENEEVYDFCDEYDEVYGDFDEGGAAHDALSFALGYLGVKDLLVVEKVCRSLRDTVRSDPLLWRSIHIDHPLNEKITDEALVKLTDRAQGTLQCLSLVNCSRITNTGLNRTLERNPRLMKLSVPGCLKLSIEGILSNLRAFKSVGSPGIKLLRVGDRKGVTDKQFEELKYLLGADDYMQLRSREPLFYGWDNFALSCDDDRAIDIESCPKCQKVGIIYDCPTESCQAKPLASHLCRACMLCIERCVRCGRCFNDSDYEETFCLDSICLDCLRHLLISEEEPGDSSSTHTIICQATRYEFRFYG